MTCFIEVNKAYNVFIVSLSVQGFTCNRRRYRCFIHKSKANRFHALHKRYKRTKDNEKIQVCSCSQT